MDGWGIILSVIQVGIFLGRKYHPYYTQFDVIIFHMIPEIETLSCLLLFPSFTFGTDENPFLNHHLAIGVWIVHV